MNNCIEYLCIWLGLSKLGVVSALINYNQRLHPLGHSIAIAKAKALIIGADLQEAVEEAIKGGHVDGKISLYVYGKCIPGLKGVNLAEEIPKISRSPPKFRPNIDFRSKLFYIYTSGTTGMPKAAVITHARYRKIICLC